MKAIITIECDNAAFEDNPCDEICRILRELAKRLPDDLGYVSPAPINLYDINGNHVGECRIEA